MMYRRQLFACTIFFIIACCLLSLNEDVKRLREDKSVTATEISSERNKTVDKTHNNTTEILIQLSGQFGNHLSKIASGVAVALELESRGRHASITLLRPRRGHSRAQTAALLQECFPSLRNISFDNVAVENNQKPLSWNDEHDFDDVMDEVVKSEAKSVLVDHLSGLDLIVDRHCTALRRFFTMDCCSPETKSYQTIFHYRNFEREMPRRGKQKGYEEIGAQLALNVFHDSIATNSSAPILIVTPFAPDVKPYVNALQNQGLIVHIFCMLRSATESTIGLARSTFFLWAGLLGTAPRIRAYSVDSELKRQSHSPVWDRFNWTHPELKERFSFELYQVPE